MYTVNSVVSTWSGADFTTVCNSLKLVLVWGLPGVKNQISFKFLTLCSLIWLLDWKQEALVRCRLNLRVLWAFLDTALQNSFKLLCVNSSPLSLTFFSSQFKAFINFTMHFGLKMILIWIWNLWFDSSCNQPNCKKFFRTLRELPSFFNTFALIFFLLLCLGLKLVSIFILFTYSLSRAGL